MSRRQEVDSSVIHQSLIQLGAGDIPVDDPGTKGFKKNTVPFVRLAIEDKLEEQKNGGEIHPSHLEALSKLAPVATWKQRRKIRRLTR